ncbi:MAG: hypothetical protein WBO34_11505 [Gammaproteobacteria bacterium]
MKIASTAMVFLLLGLCLVPGAGSVEDADFDAAFPPEPETGHVNEGALEFLAAPPPGKAHAHSNRITLTASSLQDGWARLYQCHDNLDSVPAAQIVYSSERVRKLQVASVAGIGRARVEGHTVQLQDVSDTAGLCIFAESRVVHKLSADRFMVRNGPFMRRFLDGYYPMHVTLEIQLPPGDWVLEKTVPAAQSGFAVTRRQDTIVADAWFEGKLVTEFYFMPADSSEQPGA